MIMWLMGLCNLLLAMLTGAGRYVLPVLAAVLLLGVIFTKKQKAPLMVLCVVVGLLGALCFPACDYFVAHLDDYNTNKTAAVVEETSSPAQETPAAEENKKSQEQVASIPSKIIGATKDQVSDIMKNADYSPAKSYYDYDMAFKKTGKVEVHIIFNDSGTAIGTAFFSLDGKSTGNGSESYVNKHYDELIKFSNGDDTTLPIKNNVNNKDRKYPSEVYVGDQRDND